MATVTSPSRTIQGVSLWPRLADLPLVVESCEYDGLHAVLANKFNRVTTHARLIGAGADGLSEDISLMEEDGTSLHEARPALGLEGEWTLASFCVHLARLDLFVKPPEREGRRTFAAGRSSRPAGGAPPRRGR